MNLSSAVNPTWFTEDVLGQGPLIPLPSTVWAKESTGGAVIPPSGWTPATMTKIFNYLTAQAKSLSTYATNPLWQVVDGPYKLSAYNATTGGFTLVPNTTYGGPHVTPMSSFQGVPFTSNTAEFNAIRSKAIDVAYVDFDDVPQLPTVLRVGYSYFGEPDFGLTFAAYNFKDTTGDFNNIIAQLYIRQALAHLVDQQGWITAFMHGAGAPAYGPIPAYPQSPYLPTDAATNPYPFSVSDRRQHPEGQRLDRQPRRHRRVRQGRHRRGRLRGGHPGRHQAGVELHLQHLAGADRRPGHRLRVEGERRPASTSRCPAATSTT